jgi:hypothetical protein
LQNNPEIKDTHSVYLNIEASSVNILGSADQLNQVFWNLSQNAIRAMPHGGELRISIRATSDVIGEICFQDNGVGMSEEERERIFQPFHSGFKGGHGLGLSIIFQIMEEHRARISFEGERERDKVALLPAGRAVTEPENLELAAMQDKGAKERCRQFLSSTMSRTSWKCRMVLQDEDGSHGRLRAGSTYIIARKQGGPGHFRHKNADFSGIELLRKQSRSRRIRFHHDHGVRKHGDRD